VATYILVANPSTIAADIRVRFGTPPGQVELTCTVPPTSRFNIDVAAEVVALADSEGMALVTCTNGVEIAVEKAMYWNSGGVLWSGRPGRAGYAGLLISLTAESSAAAALARSSVSTPATINVKPRSM
jgi:hypothetical protein